MSSILRIAIVAIAAAFVTPAGAELYKWVDANGRVQYSDKPPPGGSQGVKKLTDSRVGTSSGPSTTPAQSGKEGGSAAATAPSSVAEQEQAFRKRRMEADEARQKELKLAQQQQQKDDACKRAKNYLSSLESGGRQVRMNDKGEREFLDDNQIQQEMARARQEIANACN